MTIHYDPRPATRQRSDAATHGRRTRRWAVPAALAAVATVAVIGAVRISDGTQGSTPSVSSPAPELEFTKAQVLVQQYIDAALARNHASTTFTLAQTLVQQSIDEALAEGG